MAPKYGNQVSKKYFYVNFYYAVKYDTQSTASWSSCRAMSKNSCNCYRQPFFVRLLRGIIDFLFHLASEQLTLNNLLPSATTHCQYSLCTFCFSELSCYSYILGGSQQPLIVASLLFLMAEAPLWLSLCSCFLLLG